jgi:hypothetical protein
MTTSGSKSGAQSERSGTRGWSTCFISASPRVDLDTIKMLLSQRGIAPRTAGELSWTSGSPLSYTTRAIAEADLFIALLHGTEPDPNVYMEIAYAQAFGKRVLILVPPELKSLPSYVMDMIHIRADPRNREAIGFALDQILAAPRPEKHRREEPSPEARAIGDRADMLLAELDALGDHTTGRDLEEIVTAALEASSIPVVRHADQPPEGADLVIWADELNSWVGNPVLVEIKKTLGTKGQTARLVQHVCKRLQDSDLRGALVVYERPSASGEVDFSPDSPLTVLFVSIHELLEGLRVHSLGEIVRRVRNRQAHGGGAR